MLNIDKTILISFSYLSQKDLLLRAIVYSVGVIIFVEFTRAQIPEVNLLQLVPGFYLFLLFISFLFIVFFSSFFVSFPLEIDAKKGSGTKTLSRFEEKIVFKFFLVLVFFIFLTSLNSVIPLGLDSFNSYGEKTLENVWSFDEVLVLEIILLLILVLLFQFPFFSVSLLNNEKEANILPKYWKQLSLIIFIMSGFLTPTIDGYTQLSLSFTAFSLYLIVISIIGKRINIKFNVFSVLGF